MYGGQERYIKGSGGGDLTGKRPRRRRWRRWGIIWNGLIWLRIGTGGGAVVNAVMNFQIL
jgi:hypothetical protein